MPLPRISLSEQKPMRPNYTTLDLEEHGLNARVASLTEQGKQPKLKEPVRQVPVHLENSLVENFHLAKPRSVWDIFISALGHAVAVTLIILIPLCYTHAIDLPQFEKTFLIAPPPPPPPPPPAPLRSVQPHFKSFFAQNKLFAPRFIPKQIAQIKEQAPNSPPAFGGTTGGVPGGVPGGQLGGVLGGILGGSRAIIPPPPPIQTPAHLGPYRVRGRVQAPTLIRQVQPVYPILAKQARVQGDVQIDSVIDQQGNVTEMKVVSGSPLLVTAALNAVRQWKYQPTLLNGQPIPVAMVVTVHFTLAN
jgi:periplasmic protein TonB